MITLPMRYAELERESPDFRHFKEARGGRHIVDYSRVKNSSTERKRRLRVLMVYPYAPSLNSKLLHLGKWTCQLCFAHDGYRALHIAATQRPQVVFIKLEMPWMTGCQLARHLRTDYSGRDCLIVGITSLDDSSMRKASICSGVDILLAYPASLLVIETLLLLECIRQCR